MPEYKTFDEIVIGMLEGFKYTRAEWGNEKECVFLKDGTLSITRDDPTSAIPITHAFIVRDVDMLGEDWYTVG